MEGGWEEGGGQELRFFFQESKSKNEIWGVGPSSYLKNVSNGTFTPQGQQLCRIILKSMHKCTSYGPDKLNTCI